MARLTLSKSALNFFWLSSALLSSSLCWALQAPDFTLAQQKGPRGLQVIATPPAGNHINIQAPMYLQKDGASERVRPASAEEKKVVFQLPSGSGGDYLVNLFLCDDQKTYCEAHKVKFTAEGGQAASGALEPSTSKPAAPSPSSKKKTSALKKNAEGFILNQPEEALALAARENKPLLIDFYGIWCPPCNMLDTDIFTSPEFKKASSRFVKLKMDADAETALKLRARYNISAYPSVILADSKGDEILRIVGYLRKPGFLAKMNEAWESRDLSKPNPIRQGLVHLERKEYEKAVELLKDVPSRREEFASAEIGLWEQKKSKVQAASPADPKLLSDTEAGLITTLERSIQTLSDSPLSIEWRQNLAELYSEKAPEKKKAHLNEAIRLARQLISHPELLEKYELTLGDTWTSLAQAQEALASAPNEIKESWTQAAEAFGKNAKTPHERGNNLERAYCLRKAGDFAAAEEIYRRLEGFYPQEFTFYNAHASMEFDRKNLAPAEELAKKALQFSYGDNKLRVSLLLAKIYNAAGKKAKGIELIQNTLKEFQTPAGEMPRAQRTIKALKELLEKLSAK